MTVENIIAMRKRQFVRLCVLSLGIILFCTQLVSAQRPSSPTVVPIYSPQSVLQQLTRANVVYLGEAHGSPEDHLAQQQIIEQLHRQNPNLAIAMEMFQRPYQFYIDRYLANDLIEPRLRELTRYRETWDYPWEYYAPILRFAKANRLPVLAINAPTEITSKVARGGLESLSRLEQQYYIPPLSDIRTNSVDYRQLMAQIYQRNQPNRRVSNNFERYFQAQVLWNETMGEVIAKFLQANPDFQVVVLVGHDRIIYGYGIPSTVERRIGSRNLVQKTVLINPSSETAIKADKPVADFIWRTRQVGDS